MKKTFLTITIATLLSTGIAQAQDYSSAINARQGQMRMQALNISILGAMAKGELEYDAGLAQAAADNLVAISNINQLTNWPEGSEAGANEGTRAKPEIWSNSAGFQEKWAAFAPAAVQMQAAAGQGAAEIGAAIGAVGGTCKGCHDDFREPQN